MQNPELEEMVTWSAHWIHPRHPTPADSSHSLPDSLDLMFQFSEQIASNGADEPYPFSYHSTNWRGASSLMSRSRGNDKNPFAGSR